MQTPRGEIIRFHMDDCRRIEPVRSSSPEIDGQPCLTSKPHNLIPKTREDNGVGDKIVFVLDPEWQGDEDKPSTVLAWGYECYWQKKVAMLKPAPVQAQSNPAVQSKPPTPQAPAAKKAPSEKKNRSVRQIRPIKLDIDLVTEIEDLNRRSYGSDGKNGHKKNGHRPHRNAETDKCVR
jgi:hypothetical protein